MILHFVKHLFLYVRVPSRITCRIPVLVEKCQKVPESWGSAASGVPRKLIKKLLLQWEPNWEDLLILSVNVETEHQSVLCHLVGFPVSDLGKKQRTMPLQLPYQLLAPKTCTTSVKDTVSSKASHESQVNRIFFDFLLSSTVYLNSSLVRVSVEFDRWKARIPEDSSWFPWVH